MHFVVFIPDEQTGAGYGFKTPTPLPDLLRSVGLGNLSDDHPVGRAGVVNNRKGKVIGWQTNAGALSLDTSEAIEWIPASQTEEHQHSRYFIGINPQAMPTPDELARQSQFKCEKVKLGDGRDWWFVAEKTLERNMRYTLHGEWVTSPQRKFLEFCDLTDHWRQLILSVNPTYTWGAVLSYCQLSLGINYRLTPEIESRLGLWTINPHAESEEAPGSLHRAFHKILERAGVMRGGNDG